jgi:hypothetical protein
VAIGPTELLIVLALALTAVAPILALVDVSRQPTAAWEASEQDRTLWIVLNAIGIAMCGVGLVIALVYAAIVRPKVVGASGA